MTSPGFPGILENRSSSLEFLFFVAANVRNELARQRAVVKIGTARIGSKQRIEIKARVRHRRARTQFVGVERFEKCPALSKVTPPPAFVSSGSSLSATIVPPSLSWVVDASQSATVALK